PSGANEASRSPRPPTAPTGNPPPITLPKHHRSGDTPDQTVAPPGPIRNPVITSSKMSSAPAASHAARSPARKPGAGGTRFMFAATGSTITQATSSSSAGTTLYGATRVSATAPFDTPTDPGRPSMATPLPPPASSPSEW